MADSKSGFPWASVAVLAAFVGSTQLVPHAFQQLRPPEKERAQTTLNAELEVDARLWEDPFAALRRFEAERAERCEKARKQGDSKLDCSAAVAGARRPESLRLKLDRDGDKDLSETMVLLALVPGNPFVGAEEGRRRTRYAILAGLQAQDYVPDNAERIGLLEFDIRNLSDAAAPEAAASDASSVAVSLAQAGSRAAGLQVANRVEPARESKPGDATIATPKFVVPFEMLSVRNLKSDAITKVKTSRYEQVALLWIDETALPTSKLNSLARLIDMMFGPQLLAQKNSCADLTKAQPHIAMIGPSSTDALRVALADLRLASERLDARKRVEKVTEPLPYCGCSTAVLPPTCKNPFDPQTLDQAAIEGYRLIASTEILNSASTAPDSMLPELKKQEIEAFLNDKFNRILGGLGDVSVDFERTINTDDVLIEQLVAELRLRLPAGADRRVVLVAERDSLYSQALVNELKERLSKFHHLAFEVVYFFRGLDGVTTRDSSRENSADKGGGEKSNLEKRLEWPETRDQLDYLRRLSLSLKQSEQGVQGQIGAIGIFGNDVHDKLLVLQALHDTFSDKVFFTTDMDARFLHPRTQAFTRNLIVASSLPLAFYRPTAGQTDLQAGTPPLRDVYQVSSYLAARRAGCKHTPCQQAERDAADLALASPSLYEVGRNGAVPLSGYALTQRPAQSGVPRGLVAGALVTLLLAGLLVWPSTPAIKQARAAFLARPLPDDALPMNLPSVILVALHSALLAYVLCSLIEFVNPKQLSFVQTLLLAALAAFAALLAVLPTLLATQKNQALNPDDETSIRVPRVDRLHVGLLLLAVAGWVWVAWPHATREICLDCEPVTWLEGVSAWPSHLIHLLALVTILCCLDVAWSDTLRRMKRDSAWLRLPPPMTQKISRTGLRSMLDGWFKHISILTWQRERTLSNDFEALWAAYGSRGESRPRAARTLVWYGLTVLLMGLVFFGLSEGQIPEVPVRGDDHRKLVSATLYAILLLLPLLVVAVADATVLAFSFIRHLNSGRTAYPPPTVEKFAYSLGEQQAALWLRRIKAKPADRLASFETIGASDSVVHTLMDDWIDVLVVARRTESVSRLVIGPFVVLALLVVARSRLFDNWSLTPAIAIATCFYLAWLIILASLLKIAAERTRKRALLSMNADLRWLAGSGPELAVLVEPFKRLIVAVENNQIGAFAPFFEQPLLKAMLVPLGGAGGAQLFDYLLLAR